MSFQAPEGPAHAAEPLAATPTDPDPFAGARFSITIDGVEIATFAELAGLSSGIDPSALTLGQNQKGKPVLKKLPGKRTPPTVTVKRGLTTDLSVSEWHHEALSGASSARRDAELVVRDSQAQAIAKYHLESAWPAKVDVLKSGSSDVLMETVTIVCEDIQRVAP